MSSETNADSRSKDSFSTGRLLYDTSRICRQVDISASVFSLLGSTRTAKGIVAFSSRIKQRFNKSISSDPNMFAAQVTTTVVTFSTKSTATTEEMCTLDRTSRTITLTLRIQCDLKYAELSSFLKQSKSVCNKKKVSGLEP